ncbi:MAG TPA: EF-hand domain-containing protein [Allosphingosinicella sp.]|jgi:hypothetical protein
MKSLITLGAVLLAATPLYAQSGEGRARFAQPQTRAAVAAQVQVRFARADSNRDGFVTQDEVRARTEARREQRGERREQRFERLDFYHDGMISRSEFDAPRAVRGGDRGERRGQRFAARGGRGGMAMARFGARAFAAMDSDRDGRVALAEAQRVALRRFDRVDPNRDGTISPSERQAARAARIERREERPRD